MLIYFSKSQNYTNTIFTKIYVFSVRRSFLFLEISERSEVESLEQTVRSNKVSVLGAFCAVFLKLVQVNNTIHTKYGMPYLISFVHFVLRETIFKTQKGLILCLKVISNK